MLFPEFNVGVWMMLVGFHGFAFGWKKRLDYSKV
jgi:hypothetical protein